MSTANIIGSDVYCKDFLCYERHFEQVLCVDMISNGPARTSVDQTAPAPVPASVVDDRNPRPGATWTTSAVKDLERPVPADGDTKDMGELPELVDSSGSDSDSSPPDANRQLIDRVMFIGRVPNEEPTVRFVSVYKERARPASSDHA